VSGGRIKLELARCRCTLSELWMAGMGMGAGARRKGSAFSELSKVVGASCKLEVGQDSAFTRSCARLGSRRKTQQAERRS